MNAPALQSQVTALVAGMPEVLLVYLFGSRAGASAGPMSDYDLGVLIGSVEDEDRARAEIAHGMACVLQSDRIDVVLLNRAPVELAYAIIAQGQILYQRDVATRVEYEAQVLSRYGDYLPVLRAQRDDILRGDDYASRVCRYREAFGRTERTIGQVAAAQGEGED